MGGGGLRLARWLRFGMFPLWGGGCWNEYAGWYFQVHVRVLFDL